MIPCGLRSVPAAWRLRRLALRACDGTLSGAARGQCRHKEARAACHSSQVPPDLSSSYSRPFLLLELLRLGARAPAAAPGARAPRAGRRPRPARPRARRPPAARAPRRPAPPAAARTPPPPAPRAAAHSRPARRGAVRPPPPPRPPGSARGGTCSWSRVSAHCASVVIALPGPLETRWAASMRFCARAVLLASPDEAALPQAQGMSQSTRRGRLCTDHGTDTVPTTAGDWLYASTALPHAHLQTPPWRCQPPARLGDVGHARGAEELERLAQQALAVLWQDLHACTSTQYSATY